MLVIKEHVRLKGSPDFSSFQFTTQSQAGPVVREFQFVYQKEKDVYNLELIDSGCSHPKHSTSIDSTEIDEVITMMMQVIELYTERHPERTIRLKGDTHEKAKLYRSALDLHCDLLFPIFDIGMELEKPFSFRSQTRESLDAIAFLLRRRPGTFISIHTIQTTLTSRSLLLGNKVSVELHRYIHVGLASSADEN